MKITESNPFKSYLREKQRDIPTATESRQVPESLKHRYPSWDAYQEALAEFLNGN